MTCPSALLRCLVIPSRNEVPPGKSEFSFPVPCHDKVQPPDCLPILSAPSPATKIVDLGDNGKIPLFLIKT